SRTRVVSSFWFGAPWALWSSLRWPNVLLIGAARNLEAVCVRGRARALARAHSFYRTNRPFERDIRHGIVRLPAVSAVTDDHADGVDGPGSERFVGADPDLLSEVSRLRSPGAVGRPDGQDPALQRHRPGGLPQPLPDQ